MKINLGTSPSGPVSLDLDVLLRTRLLVQASSGGGKSWLLRRLTEQLFGKVQVLIIDPEGEFATLRERHGYVLVGKGGETPADRRSAGLVAHKLLELNASAVCDLYEMPPRERHAWVRVFLEALIDAPKTLWHPVVVVVDEAHVFAPEKGAGESEASDAMIGLATRGRKRGFSAVFATQRLGKLRKDAAAELLNVLIGQTFIDVDRKRAAEALGIAPAEQREFFAELRLLKPGKFWALGRAIATERTLVTVGSIETTHPEAGSSKHSSAAPPAPETVKRLLPKLSDLPAEAEAKAKTEAELRQRITALERDLTASKAAQPETKVERVEVPVLKPTELVQIQKLVEEATRLQGRTQALIDEVAGKVWPAPPSPPRPLPPHASASSAPAGPAPRRPNAGSGAARTGDSDIGRGGLRRILVALAQRPRGLSARQIGVRAGLSSKGGTFSTYISKGRASGWIEGDSSRYVITGAGLAALGEFEPPPTGEELLRYWLRELGQGGASRMLAALAEAYPKALTNDQVAERAGVSSAGGTFSTYLSKLRTLELIEGRGELRASEELFG